MIAQSGNAKRFAWSVLVALVVSGAIPGAEVFAHDFGGPTNSAPPPPPPPPPPPCDDGKGCSCPGGPGNRSSSPISYFNGSESVTQTDLVVEGVFPIAIMRKYDSQSAYDSPLGYGWSFLHDRRLYEYPDGSVIVRHGCGARDRYVPNAGSYTSPAGGMLATLVSEGNGSWQLRYAAGEKDFFDSQGRLTAIQNSRGDRQEFTYDNRGKLPVTGASNDAVDPNLPMIVAYVFRVTRIDERAANGSLTGHYVTFGYDESTGRVVSVTADDGRTVGYAHDISGSLTKGNLTQVTGLGGIARTYAYADPLDVHNLTSVIEAPGRTAIINTYDDQDRVVRQEEGARKIEFAYQVPLSRTVVTKTIRDQNGLNGYTSATTYEFDPTGRITKITDPFGNESRYTFNANKQLTRKEIWQNNAGVLALLLARNWTYDLDGHRKTESVTLDSGEIVTRSWTYSADWVASEQVVSSAAPGKIFRTEYTFNLGPDGQPASIESMKRRLDDGSFQTTAYAYDSQNRLLSTTLPDGVRVVNEYTGDDLTRTFYEVSGVAIADGERRFEYDARGLLTKQWDARGNLSQLAYDDLGRRISAINPLGQEKRYTYTGDLLTQVEMGRTTADGEGQVTKYLYDSQGRMTTVQRKNDSGALVTYQTTEFDSEGHELTVTDAAGRVTRYSYDLEGRTSSVVDPANQTTQFFYDAAGRRTRIGAPLGREVNIEYDDLGRRTAIVQKDISPNPRTEFVYDAVGDRLSVLDAEGHTTSYAFDALSRLTAVTRPLGQQTQFTYDNRDRVDYLLNARGQKIDFGYESWGPLSEQKHYASAGAPMPLRTITVARDHDGNVISITDDGVQAGPMLTYSHDGLGRVLDETTKYIPGGDHVLQRRYDRFGNQRESTLVDGNSFVSTYTYDKLNQLTSANLTGNSLSATYLADSQVDIETLSGVVTRDLGYDTRGLVNSIASAGPAGQISQLSYAYDNAGRVDTYTDASGIHDASYDGLDRVTSITHPAASGLPLSEAFAYDRVGNREDAGNASLFQYDANNRVAASPGLTYGSDADGNVTTSSNGRTFAHDLLNRMTSFTGSGVTADYLYDMGSRRIRKSISGQSTWYLWDGPRLLAQFDNAGVQSARYVYVPGATTPALFTDPHGSYWTHADRLGAVRTLTTSNGTVVWTAQFSAYGGAIVAADPDANGQAISFPLRLPGQYEDEESGLYYNLARIYDPAVGRYFEEDPLPGSNQYWYANGNPLSAIDPLGLRAIYKWPPNNYGDMPPPPGTPCLQAVFRRGVLMGWEPCSTCPDDESGDDNGDYGYGHDGWPSYHGPNSGSDDGGDSSHPEREGYYKGASTGFGGTINYFYGLGCTVTANIGTGGMSDYGGCGVGIGGSTIRPAWQNSLNFGDPTGWGLRGNITGGAFGQQGAFTLFLNSSGANITVSFGQGGGGSANVTGGYRGTRPWGGGP